MASYNVQMNMLNESGTYDEIYPRIKSYFLKRTEFILGNGTLRNHTKDSLINNAIQLGSLTRMYLSYYSIGVSFLECFINLRESAKSQFNTTDLFIFFSKDIYNFLGDKETIGFYNSGSNAYTNSIEGDYFYNDETSLLRAIFYFIDIDNLSLYFCCTLISK